MENTLKEIFTNFLEKESIFRDKEALRPTYLPETILHRTDEIKQLAIILAPILKGEAPSNVLIFGRTGVGKTVVTKHVCGELKKLADEIRRPIKITYINCRMEKINTEYRLLARLSKDFGKKIPVTGLPTDAVYRNFFKLINKSKTNQIVILDEMDAMDRASDALYDLVRINYELTNGSRVSLIGISNKISFMDAIEPKVKSSFEGEDIVFPPYNAKQLKDILLQRANKAFLPNTLSAEVIPKCAALAAQEHGDARRALNLLRVAAEIADRRGDKTVTEDHVELAEERIDMESATETVATLPKQSQAVLLSIIQLNGEGNRELSTGDVCDRYHKLCNHLKLKHLTQRRVSDLISELDILGIIKTRIISKGRYGRTREIGVAVNEKTLLRLKQILNEELLFE